VSNNQNLHAVPGTIDVAAVFGYPATARVLIFQSDAGDVHDIWYAGAPSTSFPKAPNGSRLNDTTNADVWIKTNAVGSGIDGTWTKASP
jgi:hypothetical protein